MNINDSKELLDGPVQPETAQKPTKVSISNFSKALNCFVPVLVNEAGDRVPFGTKGATWTGDYEVRPGKEEEAPEPFVFMNLAFGAMHDVYLFIKEHEQFKMKYSVLADDVRAAYGIAHAGGVRCESLEQTVIVLAARAKQAQDIIERLINANENNQERIKTAARGYLNHIVPSQKAVHNGLSTPIASIPQPPLDNGGAEATDSGFDEPVRPHEPK